MSTCEALTRAQSVVIGSQCAFSELDQTIRFMVVDGGVLYQYIILCTEAF